MENLANKDTNELIVEAIATIVSQVTDNIKKDNSILYTDTQKRIIEIENNFRDKIQNHEERIIDLEAYLKTMNEFEKTFLKVRKHGYKIFTAVVIFFVILMYYFRKTQ